jgi:hypothetical protein
MENGNKEFVYIEDLKKEVDSHFLSFLLIRVLKPIIKNNVKSSHGEFMETMEKS